MLIDESTTFKFREETEPYGKGFLQWKQFRLFYQNENRKKRIRLQLNRSEKHEQFVMRNGITDFRVTQCFLFFHQFLLNNHFIKSFTHANIKSQVRIYKTIMGVYMIKYHHAMISKKCFRSFILIWMYLTRNKNLRTFTCQLSLIK